MANQPPIQNNIIPPISATDLADPALSKLNRNFQLLGNQLAKLLGSGDPATVFAGTVQAAAFNSPNTAIPNDPTQLLTRGAADALYAPQIIRNAILSGQWEGFKIEPFPFPKPSGGGGAGTPTIMDITLVANLTLGPSDVASPAAAGQWLVIFLRQNATGGYVATFSSPPFRGTLTGLSTLPSTWSALLFISQVDPADTLLKWWRLAPPVTGQS
jgi:hypothetical protein